MLAGILLIGGRFGAAGEPRHHVLGEAPQCGDTGRTVQQHVLHPDIVEGLDLSANVVRRPIDGPRLGALARVLEISLLGQSLGPAAGGYARLDGPVVIGLRFDDIHGTRHRHAHGVEGAPQGLYLRFEKGDFLGNHLE